ncbi:MAG: diaminopimelate decarboxylase, partial [Desulfobacula sp.]|nr:diaminopimelate decarboxylase [Desulfobacula sp.]
MDLFTYKNGKLFAEDVDVETIAKKVGTPVYIYSKATFLDHLKKIKTAYADIDTTICYSVKACGNINILKIMAEAGSGFDIVSGGELYRASQTGVDMGKIVYAGVGKTDAEIIEALDAGIGYFNVESEEELENLIKLCKANDRSTKSALRINPDIKYDSHKHITTGVKETKFGVDMERAVKIYEKYADNGVVEMSALHVHLGSGGKTVDPYVNYVKKALPLVRELRRYGHKIDTLDLGGGYGADYETATVPSALDYASQIVPLLKAAELKLILEPGKSIMANAGIMLTRTLFKKSSGAKNFIIVDAGMNNLIRPCLYDAFHFIWPARVSKDFVPEKRIQGLQMNNTHFVDVV